MVYRNRYNHWGSYMEEIGVGDRRREREGEPQNIFLFKI